VSLCQVALDNLRPAAYMLRKLSNRANITIMIWVYGWMDGTRTTLDVARNHVRRMAWTDILFITNGLSEPVV
jgi:hypothetical protein